MTTPLTDDDGTVDMDALGAALDRTIDELDRLIDVCSSSFMLDNTSAACRLTRDRLARFRQAIADGEV